MTRSLLPKFIKIALWSCLALSLAAPNCSQPAGPSAAELLALTTTCNQLAGVTDFSTDSGGRRIISLCGLTDAIWFAADMDIDCDGGTASACTSDPYYQPETSAVDSQGNPLDASNLPFVVLPLPSNGFNAKNYGITLGTVAAVIYNNRLAYGVFGDFGPKGVVGEASYAMANVLGIDPDPVSGGISSGVTYIFFGGSDAKVSPIESQAQAEAVGIEQATQLLAQ
jgi:hypothetical protein